MAGRKPAESEFNDLKVDRRADAGNTGAMIRTLMALGVATIALAPVSAAANDASAVLGAGGIQYVPNASITMVEEDLEISREQVNVSYTFRNIADEDITSLIAFPLPVVDLSSMDPIGFQGEDGTNFVDFTVVVDGEALTPDVELKAEIGGVDVTAQVAGHDIPINAFAGELYEVLKALSDDAKADLRDAGLLAWNEAHGELQPLWSVRVTYHWLQTFPGGGETKIAHSYRPVAGASFFGQFSLSENYFRNNYCVEGGFARAAQVKIDEAQGELLVAYEVHYILKTANTWHGPIGRFHLTVDKGDEANLVSLCINDIEKTGPSRFEVTLHEYVPTSDLQILFLEHVPQ